MKIQDLNDEIINKLNNNNGELTANEQDAVARLINTIYTMPIDVNNIKKLNGYDVVNAGLITKTIRELWLLCKLHPVLSIDTLNNFVATYTSEWSFAATGGLASNEDRQRAHDCVANLLNIVTDLKIDEQGTDDKSKWLFYVTVKEDFNDNFKFQNVVEKKEPTNVDNFMQEQAKKFEEEKRVVEEMYHIVTEKKLKDLLKKRLDIMEHPNYASKSTFSGIPYAHSKQDILGKIIEEYKKTGVINFSAKKASKRVIQIDETTNEPISVFNSVRDAAKETGCNVAKISQCCNDIITSYHGYKFKFDDSYNDSVSTMIKLKEELRNATDELINNEKQIDALRGKINKLTEQKQNITRNIIKALYNKDKKTEMKYRSMNEELNEDIKYLSKKLNQMISDFEDK